MIDDLTGQKCKACEGGVAPLTAAEIQKYLKKLSGWSVDAANKEIFKDFEFKNYYRVMAFVNAIAWMTHAENHHPDLEIAYDHCKVRYSTHSIGGLSENDFICAVKVDQIFGISVQD